MHRRQFLTITASSVGGVLVYTLGRLPLQLSAEEKPVRISLRFFTEDEALEVGAAAARIFPSDNAGPGAKEAGVVVYIDRQLAGPYGRDRYRYTKAPFVESVSEHGYQGKHSPRDIYREGLRALGQFTGLS